MTDLGVVWENTVDDNEYQCKVTRLDGDGYRGMLTVTNDGEVIHQEEVGLAYAARFGPDMDDVATWQDRVVQVIDNPSERKLVDAPDS
jgi:hypothetical protein